MLNKIFILLLIGWVNYSFAQSDEGFSGSAKKEKTYLFPIQPGQANSLAGTMGELRKTHFHTGIDIRTNGQTGLPVYAIADGYISRISVSPGGYGNALYVKHTDGNTSVYGHLEKFNEAISTYTVKRQYNNEQFSINLYPKSTDFKVKKGDIIAYSGNSGSSAGPHLHFDIRDASNFPLNPLIYDFEEIKDSVAPVPNKIAITTLSEDARVEGLYGRKEFDVIRKGNQYGVNDKIEVYGTIGIELLAYDYLNGSSNRCGINTIVLEIDGKEVFEQKISKLSFDLQRSIYAHYNYKAAEKGDRFHKLYIDDGNKLKFYSHENEGKLHLTEDCIHTIQIVMTDTYENSSTLSFDIICKSDQTGSHKIKSNSGLDIEIQQSIVTFYADNKLFDSPMELFFYSEGQEQRIGPYYRTDKTTGFIYNLDKGIPDSVRICDKVFPMNYNATVYPGKTFNYYSDNMDLTFGSQVLFDTLFLKTNHFFNSENIEIFEIGEDAIPLYKNLYVTLKPAKEYGSKSHVYQVNNSHYSYVGGTWKNGKISYTTSQFGKFTILKDTLAPKIKPLNLSKNSVSFHISDDLSGINKYEVTIDGQWLLMNYDYKINRIWSEKLDKNKPLQGELILRVVDNAGNIETYKTKIN